MMVIVAMVMVKKEKMIIPIVGGIGVGWGGGGA